MKQYVLILFFMMGIYPLLGQNYNLSGLSGLVDDEGNQWYEVAGYDIRITTKKGVISDSGFIRTVKRQYHFADTVPELKDFSLDMENRVFRRSYKKSKKLTRKILCYLLQTKVNEVAIIHFETFNERNRTLEKTILQKYLNASLSSYLSETWNVRAITLAGENVSLYNTCKYQKPKDLISGKTTIRWSEFPTMKAAEKDVNNRIDDMMSPGWEVVYEDDINAEFMKVPTLAYRVVYKVDKEYQYYICYYIAERVNEQYISCTIGTYSDDIYSGDIHVPNIFFRLLETPDSNMDDMESSEDTYSNVSPSSVPPFSWEVQAGTFMPLGNLSKRFATAPMVGGYVGYAVSRKLLLDAGINIAVPIKTKRFAFSGNYEDETKAVLMCNGNLRLRTRHYLRADTYSDFYGGLGLNILVTDALGGYNEYDEAYRESLYAPDIFAGLSIKRKRIGAFVEYHFVPYNLSSRIDDSFGSSMVGIGLSFGF